jgi:predicted DNA-binding transcriptional regulator YafY
VIPDGKPELRVPEGARGSGAGELLRRFSTSMSSELSPDENAILGASILLLAGLAFRAANKPSLASTCRALATAVREGALRNQASDPWRADIQRHDQQVIVSESDVAAANNAVRAASGEAKQAKPPLSSSERKFSA